MTKNTKRNTRAIEEIASRLGWTVGDYGSIYLKDYNGGVYGLERKIDLILNHLGLEFVPESTTYTPSHIRKVKHGQSR